MQFPFKLDLQGLQNRPDVFHFIQWLLVDRRYQRLLSQFNKCLVTTLIGWNCFIEKLLYFWWHFAFCQWLIVSDILLENVREVTEVFEFLEVFIDRIKFLNFLSFHWECGVYFECEFLNFIHWSFEHFKFLVNFTDIVFHLSDSVNAADELGVILKN